MSATQRCISALFLLLGLLIATAMPSAAQVSSSWPPADRGIMPTVYWWWSLTVINLTTHNLDVTETSISTSTCAGKPFHGNSLDGGVAFPLPPWRTVTWKTNDNINIFCPGPNFSGHKDFLPQGMDPKWTVRLNFLGDSGWELQQVYLTPAKDFQSTTNPLGWVNDVAPYNISCSYPGDYTKKYNVMTLSGTDLVATLYSPVVNEEKPAPSAMVTLVVRERWPHTQHGTDYDDDIFAPCLTFKAVEDY
jgi:hypothetical protein